MAIRIKNQDYLNAFEKYLLADDMPSYFIILSNKQLESNHITQYTDGTDGGICVNSDSIR